VVALAPRARASAVATAMADAWRATGVAAEAWTPDVARGAAVTAGRGEPAPGTATGSFLATPG
jgi:hypothetical protein